MATLRQFEYFVTVVDEASFTRAADLLHVTQPALSHQMRALERSVGSPLLERSPRSVRPTPTGRAVLPHARAVLAAAEQARTAARGVAGLRRGELRIAAVHSISLGLLPPILRRWRRRHPDVDIRLFEHRHGDEMAAAMATGQADLAVGPTPASWTGPVSILGVEEFVVVQEEPASPHDDSTDPGGSVRLASLADRSWVHFAPDHGLAEILDEACVAAGFRPAVGVRVEQTATAPLLAAAGLGPTLVPSTVLPAHVDGRVLHADPPVRRELAAYTRAAPDQLTLAFLDLLTTEARRGLSEERWPARSR